MTDKKENTSGHGESIDSIMYTHDRHRNIVPIDVSIMNPEELAFFSSVRPVCKTREEVRNIITPIRVDTGTGPNDYYYI